MFFHLGIPIFVSVINTGHLVASSEPSLHLDFDIKMWLNSSETSCLASHLAACIGMINVTNHLLTLRGQAFALSPITLLRPAVFSLPLFPLDSLYLAQGIVLLSSTACPPTDTRLHIYALSLFAVKGEIFSPSRFIFPKISVIWPCGLWNTLMLWMWLDTVSQSRYAFLPVSSALVLTFALLISQPVFRTLLKR